VPEITVWNGTWLSRINGNGARPDLLTTMFKGATLFALIFVFIAPASRKFLGGLLAQAGENLVHYAPYSYAGLILLLVSAIGAIIMIKTWPAYVEPENPMAKYKREVPFED
jgi:hypothetical protein